MMLHNQCASPRPSSARDQQQRPASNREAAPMQSARRSGHHARSPRNLVCETSGHRPPIDRAAACEAARMSRPPCVASAHGIARPARMASRGQRAWHRAASAHGIARPARMASRGQRAWHRAASARWGAAMHGGTEANPKDFWIQLAVGPQPLWLRNHNSGHAQRIMVKRLATSPHDPLGITDSACKNHLVVVSVQYGPFNTYIPIRSTTIGKSRVARDPIAMHTSWRSNSDIREYSIGYPRMRASGKSLTTKHRLLHASGSHPIPPPNDPKTNQYNQDLGHIHSTNGNHLESPNEGSSIDHQAAVDPPIRFTTGIDLPPSIRTRRYDGFYRDGITSARRPEQVRSTGRRRVAVRFVERGGAADFKELETWLSWIQLAVGSQPLWLRNHNSGLAQRIMVKRLATSPHDPLGITDSACKNQLVVVSVQYGPFNTYITIRSTTIGKSRVARDPITMHTSWRSNSDITSVTR
ncbi:hypothetical protein F511_11958 [Dorcoceras hygrometricum]|uniref:Uncharacterized protein n=1 Tax=Dorcoceras hygrometricum TaxID=472368 RepID=A0A2Z7DF22_9LAMI|nr:hypothetical protein F511_11958 [Dorcoceras hygrometricum]